MYTIFKYTVNCSTIKLSFIYPLHKDNNKYNN